MGVRTTNRPRLLNGLTNTVDTSGLHSRVKQVHGCRIVQLHHTGRPTHRINRSVVRRTTGLGIRSSVQIITQRTLTHLNGHVEIDLGTRCIGESVGTFRCKGRRFTISSNEIGGTSPTPQLKFDGQGGTIYGGVDGHLQHVNCTVDLYFTSNAVPTHHFFHVRRALVRFYCYSRPDLPPSNFPICQNRDPYTFSQYPSLQSYNRLPIESTHIQGASLLRPVQNQQTHTTRTAPLTETPTPSPTSPPTPTCHPRSPQQYPTQTT